MSTYMLLLWMGYVCTTEKEMLEMLNQLNGPYGLYMTILRKSNQATLTGHVEPEANFLIGFHYSVQGILGINKGSRS
jgi:hypothetical protein